MDSINGSSEFESGDLVSTVTRVMVSQNRLYSDSEEVVALQVFSEVIEMEGKQVNPGFLMKSLYNLSYYNYYFYIIWDFKNCVKSVLVKYLCSCAIEIC